MGKNRRIRRNEKERWIFNCSPPSLYISLDTPLSLAPHLSAPPKIPTFHLFDVKHNTLKATPRRGNNERNTTERSLIGWPNACIHLMKATQTKKLRDVDEKELLPLAKKIQSDYFYFKRQLKNTSLLSADLISLFYGYWMNQLVTKELQ